MLISFVFFHQYMVGFGLRLVIPVRAGALSLFFSSLFLQVRTFSLTHYSVRFRRREKEKERASENRKFNEKRKKKDASSGLLSCVLDT